MTGVLAAELVLDEKIWNEEVKMSYFCKLDMAFGRRGNLAHLLFTVFTTYTEAPPACSNAWANCSTRPSPNGGPKICKPTGSLPQILPQGTEIPGTPASEPVTV